MPVDNHDAFTVVDTPALGVLDMHGSGRRDGDYGLSYWWKSSRACVGTVLLPHRLRLVIASGPQERPPVAYAKSGSVHIAYEVLGKGPDLVWAPGAASHLDLDWEGGHRKPLMLALASFSRLIKFDKRGTGLSDRPGGVATLEERTDDIRAVMDAAGSGRAHIFGISAGGTMAILFAAMYPERTRSLILYGTKPRCVSASDYPWGPAFADEERRARNWETDGVPVPDFNEGWREWVGKSLCDDPDYRTWWVLHERMAMSPADRIAQVRWNNRIDVREVLPSIRVPTLVMSKTGDPAIEIDAARDMAARIAGARLVEYQSDGHLWYDISAQMADEVRKFIGVEPAPIQTQRVLTTILFVDIVSSTERIGSLGDAAWREFLTRYYAAVRRELRVFSGTEVDTAGDGLLATFDGPARAVRCAIAIQRSVAALGVETRAGVHIGEVERDGAAIRGIAVHMTARIAAKAHPGEILVSSTIVDLVAGSGLNFDDRGVQELKGVPRPRQLFAVAAE